MTKRITKTAKTEAALPADYAPLLAEIKTRVQVARVKASMAANKELLTLYWDIGNLVLSRQKKEGWGSKVIDRLSEDLQNELPGQQGFSPRNLKYMRAFAEAWPDGLFVQQPVAQTGGSAASIVQAPLAQLTWYHHITLLEKLDTKSDRLWYIAKAVEHEADAAIQPELGRLDQQLIPVCERLIDEVRVGLQKASTKLNFHGLADWIEDEKLNQVFSYCNDRMLASHALLDQWASMAANQGAQAFLRDLRAA